MNMSRASDSLGGTSLKVTKYEAFVNERLKSDLKTVLDCRNKLFSQITSYESLKTSIEKIKLAPQAEMKVLSDLGCNFYCKARLLDTSKIYVEIGLGFFVELTLDEAHQFCEKKLAIIRRECEVVTGEATQINAKIRLVMEALNEIQFSKSTEKLENKNDTTARGLM